ncbi:methyltransferase domain-containing protein [Desulfobacterota bacterium AH_259_B03_O07]|nr:methyltransferase domain-containing protein [Desulfobacterota bacterium AH_259_B03_O07]
MDREPSFDQAKMKEFGRLVRRDTHAMIFGCLAYIGDQLGLFKSMAVSGPASIEQLAEKSSCHQRYLREWLSAMSVAGWIEYDSSTGLFTLPPEHAPYLAQEENPSFLGGVIEAFMPMASAVPKVLDCFKSGGGLDMSDLHPDVPRVTDRLNAPTYKYFLTKTWIPKFLPSVHEKLTGGVFAADVGCGSGTVISELAKAYPNSRFVGYEPFKSAALRAEALMKESGLEERVEIIDKPAAALPDNEYEFITTFDTIHDLADPIAVISDIRRALKPTGTYLMMEINASAHLDEMMNHPLGMFLYSISTMYCVPVSRAAGGEGIGTCMGEQLPHDLCSEAGFSSFRRLEFDHPLAALYEVRI